MSRSPFSTGPAQRRGPIIDATCTEQAGKSREVPSPSRGTSQPRERAVPCRRCRRDTWNTTAVCDRCTTHKEHTR